MRKLFLAIAALLFVAMLPLHSQQKEWTLQDCIRYAQEHNISLQQSDVQVKLKEVELNTAENRMLPAFSANGTQNFSFGRGLSEDNTYERANTTSSALSLSGDMPLFSGLKIKHNITLSKLNLAAATADLQKAKDDISVSVAKAFVQILYDQEILQVAQRQVEIDSLQVVRLEAMAKAQKAALSEVAAQKAALAQSQYTETQANGNLSLAILDLTQLLELPSPENFRVAIPQTEKIFEALIPDPELIYQDALGTKASIKAEEIRLDHANTSIDLAKSGYLPTLSLNGGIGSNFYTSTNRKVTSFGEQIKNNFSQYLGLTLSIPIFQRFATKNEVRSAELSFYNQKLKLENTKKSLFKEIQQAYYTAVTSQSKLQSSKEAAQSSEEAFKLQSARYENGKANITEFNESKAKYLEAESNLVQSKYEYLFQTRLLNFYRGLPLEF